MEWKPSKSEKIELIIKTLNISGTKAVRTKKFLSGLPENKIDDMLLLDFPESINYQSKDVSEYISIEDHSSDNGPDVDNCTAHLVEMLNRMLPALLRWPNVHCTVNCMLFILGRSPFASESEMAKAYQMTRANISFRCVKLKDEFGLSNSLSGRNLTVRKIYEKRAKNEHRRITYFKPIGAFEALGD